MNETEYIYARQLGFFNPENQRFNIHIFGVGAGGSFLALTLSKLGFKDITIYDFDKVSIENIPNQFYRFQDIDKFKVDALSEIVKDFSNIEVNKVNIEITKENVQEVLYSHLNSNSLVILAFDTLEGRKLIYNECKGICMNLIDCRMGGLGYEIYCIDLTNESECSAYEKTLLKETKDLPCGMQSVIFTILSIASEVSNIIVKMENKLVYPKVLKRDLSSYLILADLNK